MTDPTQETPSEEVQELLARISPVYEAVTAEPHQHDFKVGELVYAHKLSSESVVSYGHASQSGYVIGSPDVGVFSVRLQEPISLITEKMNVNNEIELPWDCLWSEAQYQEYCEANPKPEAE